MVESDSQFTQNVKKSPSPILKWFHRILGLTALFIVIVFTIQNWIPITLRFLVWEFIDIPQTLLILISVLCGAVLLQGLRMWGHYRREHRGKNDKSKEQTKGTL